MEESFRKGRSKLEAYTLQKRGYCWGVQRKAKQRSVKQKLNRA